MTSVSQPVVLPAKSATMRDVAALAGVSLKTVSRVVNRESGVSVQLAQQVDEAVRLLGYRHNLAASSLRRTDRKTATVGLLVEDVSNPFFSALHRIVEEVAHRHGCLVLAGSSDNDSGREREMLQAFASRKVDGLIVAPAGPDHSALLHEHRLGLPVVFVDRPDRSHLADSVTVDNRAGAALAVRQLAGAGHRRIAFLGDRQALWTAAERLNGFREAMFAHGLTPRAELIRLDVLGAEQARSVVMELLDAADRPTAIFTAQNLLTIGAVRALAQTRLLGQVALVGFDDFPLADLLDPAVTVIAQDIGEIGRQAAEMLFGRINGDSSPARIVTTRPVLITRGSGEIRNVSSD